MTNMLRKKRQGGFTLMEVVVAVIVIGILAAVAATATRQMIDNSKKKALANQLAGLQQAVGRYLGEQGKMPGSVSPDGSATLGAQIDESAGANFPDYLLNVLKTDPRDYGLDNSLAVYWGYTCAGRVFATQATPVGGGWNSTNATAAVYTQFAPEGTTLDAIKSCDGAAAGGGAGGGGTGSTYNLALTVDKYETGSGQTVVATATVTDSGGSPVAGQSVTIRASGSVSGDTLYGPGTTDAAGQYVANITTAQAEYVVLSATLN